MRPQLRTYSVLVLLARASVAQTPEAPAAEAPHLYAGIGLTKGSYQSYNTYFTPPFSPALTAGIRLRPRLALEISVTSTQKEETNHYLSSSTCYDPSAQQNIYAQVSAYNRERLVIVPVLVRTSLTKAPKRPLQVELLTGVTVARIGRFMQFSAVNKSQYVVYDYQADTSTLAYYVSVGAGLRYTVRPPLELVGDALLQRALTPTYLYRLNVSATGLVSLRYSFSKHEWLRQATQHLATACPRQPPQARRAPLCCGRRGHEEASLSP
jgi:hypothetical protein